MPSCRRPIQFSAIALALAAVTVSCCRAAEFKFADVTRSSGLFEPLAGMMGHGGAWGDFDGDGRIDLFVGGFCDRPDAEYAPAKGPVPNRLFRNLGNGRFELMKNSAVESFGRTSGAVFVDLDNNGTLELYVANNAKQKSGTREDRDREPQRSAKTRPSQLFRNDRGSFVDISNESGACPESLFTARNVGVFDFDGDGLLDIFIVEDKFTRGPHSVLLRNLGGLKFKDVTQEFGLPDDIFGLGLAVADLNDDGRPDFFVGHGNRLFLSQPGNRYREATELHELFAHHPRDSEDWACGVAFGDLNRDGLLDLVVTAHFKAARNRVFLNDGVTNGVPRFREVTQQVGFGEVVPVKCPHVEIQDLDNDGWPDIYISAGWMDGDNFTPLVFRNLGVSNRLPRFIPPRAIQAPMVYFPAGPSGDYDNDGRLDICLVNWFQENHSRLLRNETEQRHWLQVQIEGKRINRMGIGAKVRIYKAGRAGEPVALLGLQEIATGYGYASGQPAICHFGLADEIAVDVVMQLPGGKIVKQRAVNTNQRITIKEP